MMKRNVEGRMPNVECRMQDVALLHRFKNIKIDRIP